MKNLNKKAFTLIELIVTIAVLGVLVLLASPRFFGYTQSAELTKGFANAKSIEKASELYYMDYEDWPRLTDDPYTSEEIESYSERIFDRTGHEVKLDPEGNYYDIDYDKLSDYVQVHDDKKNYILQNPVGKVFYMDNLNETGIARVDYSNAEGPKEFTYKKHNLKIKDYSLVFSNNENEQCFTTKGSGAYIWATSYSFNSQTGVISKAGTQYNKVTSTRSRFYEFNNGPMTFLEFIRYDSSCYNVKRYRSIPNYIDGPGEYIEDVTVKNRDTYPDNGRVGDFWYILEQK